MKDVEMTSFVEDFHGPSELKEKPKQMEDKVLGLEPWVWFSLGANLFLAASDYIVSMFGTMGPKMMMYYCAGPIVACLIYYSGQSMGWIARS